MLIKEEPLCPVFGACGGCAHQDKTYEEELRIKGQVLRELFYTHLECADEFFQPVVASPEPYYYRHRLDLTIKRTKAGLVMGFQPASRHRLIEIETCAIARKEIAAFIPELKQLAFSKMTDNYRTANIVVRTSDDSRIHWGGIGRRSLVLQEPDYLWTEIHGKRIYFSLDTFFQANLAILPLLMDKIAALAGFDRDTVFFDLYSGVGLFGIYFADRVKKTIMIEESPSSIQLAHFNKKYHALESVEIYEGKMEKELLRFDPKRVEEKFVGLIDPPRAGLTPEVIDSLNSFKFNKLFYLSCGPEALVRDLKMLTVAYKIETVMPFDFFPRTSHIETLVLLKPHA